MKRIITAVVLYALIALLTGFAYPYGVALCAGLFSPRKANGSLMERGGAVVGSELIAQDFKGAAYFWPRPSATGYSAMPSGGSNLSPAGGAFRIQTDLNAGAFMAAHPGVAKGDIPAEMLCSSASGLDPHISVEAAVIQSARVAAARGYDARRNEKLVSLVNSMSEPPDWKIFGEPRINVLKLNMAIDGIQ